MRHSLSIYPIWTLLLLGLGLSACTGPADYMPIYFGGGEEEAAGDVSAPPTSLSAGSCILKFDATLCVVLKRGEWSLGAEGQEKLCAEDLPPIPIRIQGGKAQLQGDEFPDMVISGHGLPVPITINGKGKTDGADNIGSGPVTPAGQMSIENFSIFVTALTESGKIPNLTLTTGTIAGSKDMPDITGAPAAGNTMTLVGSTVLGSILPAADKILLGATLQVTFKGQISPKLSECSGAGSGLPTTMQVTKIGIDERKRPHEQLVPNGTQMEVAGNILIPEDDADAGPPFEGSSRFRIRNISKQSVALQIPPILGAFRIKAITGSLTGTLPSQQSMVIQVTFRPAPQGTPGKVQESLSLGGDFFTLIGVAQEQRGIPSAHLLEASGELRAEGTDTLRFPELAVSAFERRAYLQCQTITCDAAASPTRCQPCVDVSSGQCQILTVDKDNLAIGEVDAQCKLLRPKAKESQALNLLPDGGAGSVSQTIVIQNTGTKILTITSLKIAEIAKSHSTAQFQVHPETVYMGESVAVVGTTEPIKLPVKLAPYSKQKLFVVVTYSPTDLLGSDDSLGGNSVTDQAILIVGTESEKKSDSLKIKLRGSTTVQESPPLEVYFRTSTGDKMRGDGSDYPIQGITMKTQNAAVAVHVKLAETAGKPLRVTTVELSDGDIDHFSWLDTREKIMAIDEAERCFGSASPVPLNPNGIDIAPQTFTLKTMPLLGCVNFHGDPATETKRKFETILTVTTVALDAKKQPLKREDGSLAESKLRIKILAVRQPRTGQMVFRLTQTMAILPIGQSPAMASVSSADEVDILIQTGRAQESDRFVFLGSIILDPFDEMEIKNEDGSVESAPNDSITAIFRAIDTRPSSFAGGDYLAPYTSLIADATAPQGKRGVFFDYPEDKMPSDYKSSGLRIYTAALSYPGPLEKDPNKIPYQVSDCQQVNPCEDGGLLGKGPTTPDKIGVCAFFYTSASSWDSPGMQTETDLCKNRDQPQQLKHLKGHYSMDGSMVFENNALRFWGPTFLHNIASILPQKPPVLDDIFHVTFTTDVLVPKEEGGKLDYVPEARIDKSKLEHMVNLTDRSKGDAVMCPNNTLNKTIGDKKYSSWKYFAPFLVQDKDGKIPAGCPEPGNSFPTDGSRAYLRGRPLDHETGTFSVAIVTKFGSSEDLTAVFKDLPLYVVLNGWLCDPMGSETDGEGSECFVQSFTDRDALSMVSILKEGVE